MAEPGGSILDSLWSWVTPRAAEAKVVGEGPAEQQLLRDVEARNAQKKGQYLYDLYARILARAQADPQTVTLVQRPGYTARTGAMAAYYPERQEIMYDPAQGHGLTHMVPHELLHFLNAQTAKQPEDVQHAVMKKVLGMDVFDPGFVPQGYQPPPLSPEEQGLMHQWLGGPR
jgi:hypothetical protein